MDDAYTALSLTASHWTNAELSHLLDALRRDRTLTIKELVKYVDKKNVNQINQLFTCLLSVSEEQLFCNQSFPRAIRGEGAVDILEQTTKHVSPDDYLFSTAAFEAIDDYALRIQPNEYSDSSSDASSSSSLSDEPHMDKKPRFSQLYRFIASATRSQPLPPLNSAEAAAVLDLLACLIRVVQRVQRILEGQPEPEGTQSASLNNRLREAWNKVATRVTDLMGIYLATCATIQWKASLSPFCSKPSTSLTRQHPIAPYFLLDSVNPPKTLKATKMLLEKLIEEFVQSWQLPKLPDRFDTMKISNLSDLSESDLHLLVKRMSAFALNPFSLSRSDMEPLQELLDTMCRADLSDSVRFSDVLLAAAPDTLGGEMIVVNPDTEKAMPKRNKRKRNIPRPIRNELNKRSRVENQEPSATLEAMDQVTNRTEVPSLPNQSDAGVYRESTLVTKMVQGLVGKKPAPGPRRTMSQFFRRIPDKTEKPVTTQTIKKFIKVCDQVQQFPKGSTR